MKQGQFCDKALIYMFYGMHDCKQHTLNQSVRNVKRLTIVKVSLEIMRVSGIITLEIMRVSGIITLEIMRYQVLSHKKS